MRIAELSRRSGVSVPSIKFYLREGLLPPGELTSPNQARYNEEHVRRLRLVKVLIDVGGLTVAEVGDVLAAMHDERLSLHNVLGRAQAAVMATAQEPVPDEATTRAHALVDALVARRGWAVAPGNPGRRAATDILAALDRLGDDWVTGLLDVYAEAVETIADREIRTVLQGDSPERSVELVVVGTVLGGALIMALRGMADEAASVRLAGAPPDDAGRSDGPDHRNAPAESD